MENTVYVCRKAIQMGRPASLAFHLGTTTLGLKRRAVIKDILPHALIQFDQEILKVLHNFGANFNELLEEKHAGFNFYNPLQLVLLRTPTAQAIHNLVDLGADINLTDPEGRVAIHVAAFLGSPRAAVEALVECGADVNHRDPSGRTPLFYTVLRLDGSQPTNDTLRSGRANCAGTLIKLGADMNTTDNEGESVLIAAIHHSFKVTKLLRVLVNNGIDINCQSEIYEKKPLFHATKNFKFDIMHFLIEHGAEIQPTNCPESNLLEFLPPKYFLELIPSLIGKGFYPKHLNLAVVETSMTPLMLARDMKRPDVVRNIEEKWFLTSCDIAHQANERCEPCSLQVIVFVKISDLLGPMSNREAKVKTLGLPPKLQERLLFR